MSFGHLVRGALALCRARRVPELIPHITPGERIPRLIHQIWFTSPPAAPPPQIRSSIAATRGMNPEYLYRLYDQPAIETFIARHYGQPILQLYRRIDPLYGAARADLFRYLLLYRLGGVYLDVKSSLQRPLREVLRPDDRYLLSHWRNGAGEEFAGWGLSPELAVSPRGEFQQWHIVAAPGHPFLRAVIGRVLTNILCYNPALDGTGWAGVLRTTGPTAYTLAILPHLPRHQHRIVDSLQELGFQYSIYASSRAHQRLFSSHYAERSEPIVRPRAGDRLLTSLLLAARSGRRRLRSRRTRAAGIIRP
jgi:inositol phosphorylceramide mannosyltransferase catalytic subunit